MPAKRQRDLVALIGCGLEPDCQSGSGVRFVVWVGSNAQVVSMWVEKSDQLGLTATTSSR